MAFREWKHLLKSTVDKVTVFTDYKNLEYFNSTEVFGGQQARWAQGFAGNNCKVVNLAGEKNEKLDILSRRWYHHLEEGDEPMVTEPRAFFISGQLVLDSAW